MAAERFEDERTYLLALGDELREVCTDLQRLNKRLRSARAAVRELEQRVAGICGQIAAREERLRHGGADSS